MAAEAGLTVGGTFPAPLLVSMEVARRAAGDTDSASWDYKRNGYLFALTAQHFYRKSGSYLWP